VGFIRVKPLSLEARPRPGKPEENQLRKKTGKEEKKRFLTEVGRKRTRKKTAFSNRQIHPIFRPPLTPTAKREQIA